MDRNRGKRAREGAVNDFIVDNTGYRDILG
jgi:hypothetical protein